MRVGGSVELMLARTRSRSFLFARVATESRVDSMTAKEIKARDR